jgi:hypothetical protein
MTSASCGSAHVKTRDNADVSVDEVAAEVVAVLARAESLFTAPGGHVLDMAATGSAAEVSATIAGRTDEMSGSFATAHADLIDSATQRLQRAADADARLVDRLGQSADAHAGGRMHASHLRSGAEEVPTRLDPWAELPASDLAVLKALRHRLADMQQLLAHHREDADRAADEIRSLEYGP